MKIKSFHRFRTISAIALALAVSVSVKAQQWSQGNPSAQEQYAVELLNRYWSNPSGFVSRYVNLYPADSTISAMLAGFGAQDPGLGTTLSQEAAGYIKVQSSTAAPVAPLALYPLLTQQAAVVRDEQGSTNPLQSAPELYQIFSWTPPSYYNPPTVLPPAPTTLQNMPPGELYHLGITSEPAFSGPNATGGTALVAAGNFNGTTGDDQGWTGFSGWLYNPIYIGPREYLLSTNAVGESNSAIIHQTYTSWNSSPSSKHLRLMGVNIGTRQTSPGSGNTLFTVYELENEAITTNDFPYGASNTAFVTGACFTDSNGNGEYDPGEGVSGLKVSINGSSWYAITASAGGFSIPVQVGTGSITVVASGTIGGQPVSQSQTVSVANDNVWLEFSFAPAKPPQSAVISPGNGLGQITNLSTRGWTTTGSGNLDAGFIIAGPATSRKTVLLRGVSYSLYQFGITTPLAKPLLTVYNSSGAVIGSASTQQTYANVTSSGSSLNAAFAQTGAFPFVTFATNSGAGAGDTAIVLSLAPGNYTFTVSPASDTNPNATASGGGNGSGVVWNGSAQPNATQGVALVELYDVSVTDGSKLVNISTRGPVVSGQGQLAVGYTIAGPANATKRLLIRGVGPALSTYGVTNFLPNPVLTLNNASGSVVLTDEGWDWGTQGTQIASLSPALGAFALPDPSADSAALLLAGPGSQTASVTSADSTNNDIALVEVYDADAGN